MGLRLKYVSACAALLAWSAPAQVTTGTILGTIRDNTGAAVPDAAVTITDVTKGTSHRFDPTTAARSMRLF